MKRLKTILSILLAVLMLTGTVPMQSIPLPDALASSGESLEIDYENTSGNSLREAEKDAVGYYAATCPEDQYKDATYRFHWVHTDELSVKNEDMIGLRKYLSQPISNYTYISLCGDIDLHITKWTEWDPIEITQDRVLDLNGHSITLRNDANKHKGGQTQDPAVHRSHMFEILNGATLTIIDSSRSKMHRNGEAGDEAGTGYISHTGVMIYPFSNDMDFYTNRDLFWVLDGTLVTYGGTFQAGRQKDQRKNKFSWSKLRQCIGTAVEVGVNIASYATGIDAAVSAANDLKAGFASQSFSDNPEDDGLNDAVNSTVKRTGADAPAEALADSSGGAGSRDKSVNEKAGGAQAANGRGSAKNENAQMAAARKNITNNVMNQSAIGGIVDGIFSFGQQIANMTGKDENSRVTEVVHGTAVHLGTDGTFVCYGGSFKGYGSTPHTRDAVVEVTVMPETYQDAETPLRGGLAYIYGGTFEAFAGANVFNFVKTNTATQSVSQASGYGPKEKFVNTVALKESETNGLQILNDSFTHPDGSAISTANVTVRGGTFRNYYELRMLSLRVPGDSEHFTKFAGTPGGLGLGVVSFNEDLIKDGRIQIIDKYGDGNLVLMDELKQPGEKVYHYRLYCSDMELRYKQYIAVQPNERTTNTTHSFRLESVTSDLPNNGASVAWASEDGSDRSGPFNQTETVFSYPLDSVATGTYYVMPHLDALDSSGAGIENSDIWYYKTPKDTYGETVQPYTNRSVIMTASTIGTGNRVVLNQQHVSAHSWEKQMAATDPGTRFFFAHRYTYLSDVKWFTYRIYRVDPLTRANLSADGAAYGEAKPLCELVYGVSTDTLKCKITLSRLEQHMKNTVKGFTGYKKGEMYRIELTMDEYLGFDVLHYNTSYGYSFYPTFGTRLPTASAHSSILFKCYSTNELKELGGKVKDVDYTPLQWIAEPEAGKYASVQIVNGQAGKTDYLGRKIFDVYYQWYAVDSKGKETMIAGTDNIYTENDDGKARHTYEYWDVDHDGKTYVNTVDPNDPNASLYVRGGLPQDPKKWSDVLLHAYTHQMTTAKEDNPLAIDTTKEPAPNNNRPFVTNEDSIYIPASLAGQKIYCKVIVVNVLWQKEFDHIQVFYSHPVQLKGEPPADPVSSTLSFWRNNHGLYVSADDPCHIHVNTLKGLREGEKVTRVTYYANGREKTIRNLKAGMAQSIPDVIYPQDFYPANYDLSSLPAGEVRVTAFLELSSGRGETVVGKSRGFRTDKAITFPFDIKVNKRLFSAGEGTVTVDIADRYNRDKLARLVKAAYQPYNATYAYSFSPGVSFTASEREIATLNGQGELLLGKSTGESEITLISPDGANPTVTVRVVHTVNAVEVSGLNAPEVGQKFDFTAEVPEDARYSVKEVKWIDEATGQELGRNAVAEDFHYYTARVTVTHDAFDEISLKADATLTVNQTDGSLSTFGEESGEIRVEKETDAEGRIGDVTFAYTFKKVKGGVMGSTVNRVFIDMPTEVAEGGYIEDFCSAVEINTDVDGFDLPAEITMAYSKGSAEILDSLGYPSKTKYWPMVLRFVKGMHTGMTVTAELPTGVTFGSNAKVYLNGRTLDLAASYSSISGRKMRLNLNGAFTVTDGTPPPANTLLVHMKDFNLTSEGGTGKDNVELNSLRSGPDASRVTMRGGEPEGNADVRVNISTDKYGKPSYQYIVYDYGTARLPIFADLDLDGDRRPDLTLDWSVTKTIYASASAMPTLPDDSPRKVTVEVLQPNGRKYTSFTYWIGRDRFTDVMKVPADTLIASVTASGGAQCTLNPDGTVTPPAGDTSVNWTLCTEPLENAVRLNAGADTVFAESDLPAMQYSSDGAHWTSYPVTGFKKDADEALLFRQCLTGEAHATAVHTAAESYGVWVGNTEVTERNRDMLPLNGWKYDPSTKTLTLYETLVNERGMAMASDATVRAVIYANHDLTLELLGSSSIDRGSPDERTIGVCAEGKLILTGTGSLRVNGVGAGLQGESVTLNNGGGLEFTNVNTAVIVTGAAGKIEFMRGNLTFTPFLRQFSGHADPWGNFCEDPAAISFEKAFHRDHRMFWINDRLYENEEGEAKLAELAATHGTKINMIIQHYGVKDDTLKNRETFDGVSCAEGGMFHSVCTVCGAIDLTAIAGNLPAGSQHDLKSYPGREPTCTEDGWSAYVECARCPYTTFEPIPALGHEWEAHDMVPATCDAPGNPAYRTCAVCGVSTLEAEYGATGFARAWEKAEHNIVFVQGKAPAVRVYGKMSHYKCTVCEALYADSAGTQPLTADEIVIPWLEDAAGLTGDVDGNGEITPGDARLALRISLGLMKDGDVDMTEDMVARADVDGKDGVQPGDARLILRKSLGLVDPEWVG